MKKDRKTIFNYLSEQVIGRFTGFMVGLWASRLISHFFTTRSIHNLWGLTAREMEVLRLLARGLSNAQIAEELVVSLLTVKAHLRSIYSKLGVTSRSAATRTAMEQHLI